MDLRFHLQLVNSSTIPFVMFVSLHSSHTMISWLDLPQPSRHMYCYCYLPSCFWQFIIARLKPFVAFEFWFLCCVILSTGVVAAFSISTLSKSNQRSMKFPKSYSSHLKSERTSLDSPSSSHVSYSSYTQAVVLNQDGDSKYFWELEPGHYLHIVIGPTICSISSWWNNVAQKDQK